MNSHASDNGNGLPPWKLHLDQYRSDELSKLTFASEDEIDAAIDLVWVGNLQGIPFQLAPDGDSLVVPSVGVPYFQQAGLHFVQTPCKS